MTEMTIGELIEAHEADVLEEDEVLEMYQQLVDTGLAWRLTGIYPAEAQRLIKAGLIKDTGAKS